MNLGTRTTASPGPSAKLPSQGSRPRSPALQVVRGHGAPQPPREVCAAPSVLCPNPTVRLPKHFRCCLGNPATSVACRPGCHSRNPAFLESTSTASRGWRLVVLVYDLPDEDSASALQSPVSAPEERCLAPS